MQIELIDSDDDVLELYVQGEPITINKDILFSFVQKQGLNYWSTDFPDPTQSDGHGHNNGYLTKEQYYNLKFDLIIHDIQLFINQKTK
jgi:hypothetical protein